MHRSWCHLVALSNKKNIISPPSAASYQLQSLLCFCLNRLDSTFRILNIHSPPHIIYPSRLAMNAQYVSFMYLWILCKLFPLRPTTTSVLVIFSKHGAFHANSKTVFHRRTREFENLWNTFDDIQVKYRQLRARRALSLFNDVPLRTRSALSLCKVNGDSALLALNGTALNSDNALLALSWVLVHCTYNSPANAAVIPPH